MKTISKKTVSGKVLSLSLLSTAFVLTGSVLQAASVQVPATANWAVHFDAKAFGQTPLAAALDTREKSDDETNLLTLSKTILGFDLEEDLHALTLYGTDKNPENFVLRIQGKFEEGKIVSYLAGRSSFASFEHREHRILQWSKEAGETLFTHPGALAFHPSGLAVMAASRDRVGKALDLLDGRVDTTAMPLPADAADPYFTVFANLKAIEDLGPQAVLLRHSNQLVVALGQKDQKVQARLTLKADNTEAARQIEGVIQGIQALALLQATGNGIEIPSWLLAATVVREDSTLHFFLDTPTETVMSLIQEHLGKR